MGAALPLRILALGIFFRLMLQLAEALGTASGSVYAVAVRQGGYAGAVVVGALSGSPWGLPGVAYGVLAAQAFAYLLTAQLCLRITGLSWREWLHAQHAGLILGGMTVVSCTVVVAAMPDMPAFVVLLSALALSGPVCLLTLVMIGQLDQVRWLISGSVPRRA
jgi:PST family polysaccharide transporter